MKTLVISGYGIRLRYRKGLILVESKDGKHEIPLFDVDQLVIATSGVWFSSKLVRKLVEHGVDLVVLDSRGLPAGRVYPPFVSRTVETRRMQYLAHNDWRGVHVIKEIVYSKLANQAGLLKRYYYYTRIQDLRDASNRISELALKVRNLEGGINDVCEKARLIEAEAAKLYWPSYALLLPRDLGFNGRDQDSSDPVNMSLNYAYGILYSECWRAIVLAGLDPYAGFLHVDRSGKPVLVFDFVESFRFIADSVLLGLFRHGWKPVISNGFLNHESRSKIIGAMNKFLDGSRIVYGDETSITLRQALKKTAYKLASFLRGESGFEGFVYRWVE
ncbi:MAG: CRISPR-associated endonuclease Cas1 [Thermosphaera sp.]